MKTNRKTIFMGAASALGLMVISPVASAHGVHLNNSVMAGFVHPLLGLDHLAMLTMTGILIGRVTGTQTSSLFKALVLMLMAMFSGALAGQELGAQDWLEGALLVSLPVMLVLHAMLGKSLKASRGKEAWALIVASLMLAMHGWAHGVELQGPAPDFISGMLVSSFGVMLAAAVLTRLAIKQLRLANRKQAV